MDIEWKTHFVNVRRCATRAGWSWHWFLFGRNSCKWTGDLFYPVDRRRPPGQSDMVNCPDLYLRRDCGTTCLPLASQSAPKFQPLPYQSPWINSFYVNQLFRLSIIDPETAPSTNNLPQITSCFDDLINVQADKSHVFEWIKDVNYWFINQTLFQFDIFTELSTIDCLTKRYSHEHYYQIIVNISLKKKMIIIVPAISSVNPVPIRCTVPCNNEVPTWFNFWHAVFRIRISNTPINSLL